MDEKKSERQNTVYCSDTFDISLIILFKVFFFRSLCHFSIHLYIAHHTCIHIQKQNKNETRMRYNSVTHILCFACMECIKTYWCVRRPQDHGIIGNKKKERRKVLKHFSYIIWKCYANVLYTIIFL